MLWLPFESIFTLICPMLIYLNLRKNFSYGTRSLGSACIASISSCNLLKLMYYLVFVMKCLLSSTPSSNLHQTIIHLLTVSHVNLPILNICALSKTTCHGLSRFIILRYLQRWWFYFAHQYLVIIKQIAIRFWCKSPNNPYHNGTSINSTENQISLSVGETLMTNKWFKQWLWKLAAAQIHNITAMEFSMLNSSSNTAGTFHKFCP